MLMSTLKPLGELENPSEFIARHIGISAADEQHMLSVIGEASRRALIESIVPRSIARAQAMDLPAPTRSARGVSTLALASSRRVLSCSARTSALSFSTRSRLASVSES